MIDALEVLRDPILLRRFATDFSANMCKPSHDGLPYAIIRYDKLGAPGVTASQAWVLPKSVEVDLRTRLDTGWEAMLIEAIPAVERLVHWSIEMTPHERLTQWTFAFFRLMCDKGIMETNTAMLQMPKLTPLQRLNPVEAARQHRAMIDHIMVLCAVHVTDWTRQYRGKEDGKPFASDRPLLHTFEPSKSDIAAMKYVYDQQQKDPFKPDMKLDIPGA